MAGRSLIGTAPHDGAERSIVLSLPGSSGQLPTTHLCPPAGRGRLYPSSGGTIRRGAPPPVCTVMHEDSVSMGDRR